MKRKKIFVLTFGVFLSLASHAQEPAKSNTVDSALMGIDTSFTDLDYEDLFNELDQLLDSLTTPRSFGLFHLALGRNFFNYKSSSSYLLTASRQFTMAPSLGYYSKSGLGISGSASIVKDAKSLNPYQFDVTASYDYLQNRKLMTGIALTRFFTKDSLPFYTSPLKNEAYVYFNYRGFWIKPSIAAGYGWGSRRDYNERKEYITSLRLIPRGYTRVTTQESINDLNLTFSLRHDFYWMNLLSRRDYVRFTPQFVFTSGTQRFGFNQTSNTYAPIPRAGGNVLFSSDKVFLDDQTYFQPLSLSTYLKAEYSKGCFFVQPQLILDYYFPANDKNFTTALVLNAGVIF